ncbi:hypothetical protein [Euzebya tangerina]|uniref:hypothetical protein n=1 Tax=Euzebya tangerina TaxID=591198 RepID=UPI000E321666|nr:hypothetical protein [Euzebya tangerina]
MPDEVEGATPPTTSVGVLLVHGIGEQQRGRTVTSWADALLAFLTEWLHTAAPDDQPVVVLDAHLRDDDDASRAVSYVDARVSIGDAVADVRFQEGWWARAFAPPSFAEVVHWSTTVLPWVLLTHLRTVYDRARGRVVRSAGASRLVLGLGQSVVALLVLLCGLLATPLLVALMGVVLVLGAVPIPWIRTIAVRVQAALAGSVGDSFVLLGSPTRAAAITASVRRSLHQLSAAYDRVVIVAHSQGAAVAYEAATSANIPNLHRFVTFGSGLRKLHGIRTMFAHGKQHLSWLATFGILVLAGAVRLAAGSMSDISDQLIGVVALVVLGGALIWAALKEVRIDVPDSWPNAVGAAQGWLNLHASHDPVSNGPLRPDGTRREDLIESEVVNRGAFLTDHGSYWSNTDGFVPFVADVLAEAVGTRIHAGSVWDGVRLNLAVPRRRWRVRWLIVSRWLALAGAARLILAFGDRLDSVAARGTDVIATALGVLPLVSWSPPDVSGAAAEGVGVLMLAAAVLAGLWLVTLIWNVWDASERRLLVRRHPYAALGTTFVFFVVALAVATVCVVVAPWVTLPEGVPVGEWVSAGALTALVGALMLGVGMAVRGPLQWLQRQGLVRPGRDVVDLTTVVTAAPTSVAVLSAGQLWGLSNTLLFVGLLAVVVAVPVIVPVWSGTTMAERVEHRWRRWSHAQPVVIAVLRSDHDDEVVDQVVEAEMTKWQRQAASVRLPTPSADELVNRLVHARRARTLDALSRRAAAAADAATERGRSDLASRLRRLSQRYGADARDSAASRSATPQQVRS